MEIPMTYLQMIKVVVLFIGNWLIVGMGFYMLVYSIYPVPISEALYCGGIYGLSAIIGILCHFHCFRSWSKRRYHCCWTCSYNA